MELETVIGIIASIASGTCLIPQLVKIHKEKKADGVSIGMLAVILMANCLWIYYGFLKEDWIIVASNAFCVLINSNLTVLKIKYSSQEYL